MVKRACFMVPVILLAVCCTQQVIEEEKFGDIVGIVYDKNVGDPISVAQVQLSPGGNSTVTGTDGSFSFKNIEAGKYTINVTKKGYRDGSNSVTVTAGNRVECNLLLERIPAFVTADKDVLDFGDNITSTTLSFNIVNSSYENLSWHIDYDKSSSSFIADIFPSSGTTQYGKTAAIVVKIDREKLNPGMNETTIVVVSDNGDGSSEVKIKAVGQEKRPPALNMAETTDIKATSAILNAEITDKGIPEYTERGFVISDSEMPTKETAITVLPAAVNDQKTFSVRAGDLAIGTVYYVRAYASNTLGIVYSTNQERFTTLAILPSVTILSTTEIKSSQAILNARITNEGTPAYTERGFVVGESKMPTKETALMFLPVAKDAQGTYSVRVGNLILGRTYYVRAYAVNAVGTAYSTAMDQFTTVGTLPAVSTLSATNEDRETKSAVLRGNISFEGDPSYTERGFVLSTVYESPTIQDEKNVVAGSGSGSFEKRVSFSQVDRPIYVRAFATNRQGTSYGETVVVFKLEYIILKSFNLGVHQEDINKDAMLFADGVTICNNSRVGSLDDWRLPTRDELNQLYVMKEEIGGFVTGQYNSPYYWSSTFSKYYMGRTDNPCYYVIGFYDGMVYSGFEANSSRARVRCVRSL